MQSKSGRKRLIIHLVGLFVIIVIWKVILHYWVLISPSGPLPGKEIVFIIDETNLGFINPDGSEPSILSIRSLLSPIRYGLTLSSGGNGQIYFRDQIYEVGNSGRLVQIQNDGSITYCFSGPDRFNRVSHFAENQVVAQTYSEQYGDQLVVFNFSTCRVVDTLFQTNDMPIALTDGSRSSGGELALRIYTNEHELGSQLWIVDDSGELIRTISQASAPAWSPDGTELLYISSGNLYISNVMGDETQLLVAGDGINCPSWSPNGDEVVFSMDNNIYIVTIASREIRLVYEGGICPTWRNLGT